MAKKITIPLLLVLFFFMMCILNRLGTNYIFKTQPSWYFLNAHSYKKFLHILGAGFGMRPLVGDIEYISFLQYYGDKENLTNGYKDLYKYISDITDVDPNFTFAYNYGSSILAWNLQRYDEAIAIIKKGIQYNPTYWRLSLYLGAIMYKQKGDSLGYMKLLEQSMKFEDHPSMLERILGNIYMVYKTPDEAAFYWVKLYKESKYKESRDLAYKTLQKMISEKKIKDINKIIDLLNK